MYIEKYWFQKNGLIADSQIYRFKIRDLVF